MNKYGNFVITKSFDQADEEEREKIIKTMSANLEAIKTSK